MRAPHRSTLRTRLTVFQVVVLLLATAVIGVVTTLALRAFLIGRLDDQLVAAGGRFSASLERGQLAPGGDDGDADNQTAGQPVGTLGVRLLGGRVTDAAVVGPDGRNRTPTFSATDTATLAALTVGGTARSVEFDRLGDYRVRAVLGRDGDVQVTGLPQHDVDETLTRLVTVEALLFAVVITASAVVVGVVVRRTLRPLERVAAVARHVADLPLTDAQTPLPAGIAPRAPTTEVDDVSTAFDQMLDHVRGALAARDATEARLRQFVADASHELRTPLAVIRAQSQAVVRDDGSDLPPDRLRALTLIDDATGRMAGLVDDLLLLARLDDGHELQLEPTDLTRILIEAVVDARALRPDHQWILDLPDEPFDVVADPRRLAQAVVNLVTNARLHTPDGTTVVVAADLDPSGEHAVVTVSDDGPGVPAQIRDTLFDRFTRGDTSRGSGRGNSGLGLAISHDIVAAHGGFLTVDTGDGGTVFTLRLPLRSSEGPAPAPRTVVDA